MAVGNLIAIVAGVIAIGVISQIFAARFRIPSVVFLIAAGIILGPEVLGILKPTAFGSALSAIVGLSVAIIVFEGAFHIKIASLREAPASTLRLVTIGALIGFIGTAVAVRFAIGASWGISLLIGALLVATGPTVIVPILDVVPVRDRVGAALETEGIVNDVTAAILAAVIFEALLTDVRAPQELLRLFAERLGIGVVLGLLIAAILYYVLTHLNLSPDRAPQHARLLVLAGALVAFAGAESIAAEAGIAAVATAGLLLGNADLPYESDVAEFKGDITLLVLSFVFIALAALLDFDVLISLGLRGIIVVAAVALIVRPLLVFISAAGDRFTAGERIFMSSVAPRGIIPASVATLFAIEFRNAGMGGEADILVGTVFLVILATVVFEAGFARQIAEALDVIPMRIVIIGGGRVGRELAERLLDRGENVVIIDNDQDQVAEARNAGFTVRHADGTDTESLQAAGTGDAKIIIAATGDDDVNLLVAQLARSTFGVENVIARVNTPENLDAFKELGVNAISSSEATAWAIDNAIERPALSAWMNELGRTGDVQEIEVTSESVAGMTIGELDDNLPGGCLIAMVSREDDNRVPEQDFTIQLGDHLTFLGHKEAVRDAVEWTHPHE